MALRFACGLFRLWLILSVLWIGGVGYVTWQEFPEDWGANDPIVEEAPSKPRSINLIQRNGWHLRPLRNAAQPFGTPAF
jgi:hypothetical protein